MDEIISEYFGVSLKLEKMVHMVDGILGFKDPNIWSLEFSGKILTDIFRSGEEIIRDSLESIERRKFQGIIWHQRTKQFEIREKKFFSGVRKHH